MKHLFFVVSLFLLLTIPLRADLSMRIEYPDETEKTELLSNIARWEIDGVNEQFRLVALDGTILAERNLYDDIRRIAFVDYNGPTVSNDNANKMFSIYPNPTSSSLYIEGLNQGETIRVFSLDGQLLVSQTAGAAHTSLDLTSLQTGVYLIQINTEFFKIIKQ
jgi:hypothetical protein